MSIKNCLHEADDITGGDRNRSYGHPLEDFERTASICTAIIGHKLKPGHRVTAEDWAMFMIGCKISRQVNKSGHDNIVDMAGYVRTLEMVAQARIRGCVYLSGPMSGIPGFNYPQFNKAAATLRRLGFIVHNPAENFGGRSDHPGGRVVYMRHDISAILHDCNGIVLLPGWRKSRGAKIERDVAIELGLSVFTFDPESDSEPAPDTENSAHGQPAAGS